KFLTDRTNGGGDVDSAILADVAPILSRNAIDTGGPTLGPRLEPRLMTDKHQKALSLSRIKRSEARGTLRVCKIPRIFCQTTADTRIGHRSIFGTFTRASRGQRQCSWLPFALKIVSSHILPDRPHSGNLLHAQFHTKRLHSPWKHERKDRSAEFRKKR